MDMAASPRLLPGEADLIGDFVRLPFLAVSRRVPFAWRLAGYFGRVEPDDQLAMRFVLRSPPFEEHGKTLFARIDRPIKLRREIIEPPLLQPLARIGI